MPKQPKTPLLPKASSLKTRGDIGTAGIGLALGYFGDLALTHFFPHLGVPAGAASVYFSSAAVGVKQVIQSYLERKRTIQAAAAAEEKTREFSEKRAKLILDTLHECTSLSPSAEVKQKLKSAEADFKSDQKFHEAGILTDEQWNKSIEHAVAVMKEYGCRAPSIEIDLE